MHRYRVKFALFFLFLFSVSCTPTIPESPVDTTLITRAQVVKRYGIVDNEEIDSYLVQLARSLLNAEIKYCTQCVATPPPRIEVVASPAPFALTIGPRNILLSRGILLTVKNEAELAFIIAHELAHTRFGHLAVLQDKSTDNEMLKNIESDADLHALGIIILAGYDPWSATAILSRLSLHLKGSKSELTARTRRIQEVLITTAWTPPGIRSTRGFIKMQNALKVSISTN